MKHPVGDLTHLLGVFGRPDDRLDDEGVAGVGDAGEGAVDDERHQGEAPTPHDHPAERLYEADLKRIY